ncbi:MAG TPA: family 20 glycosylhydrolase [Fimbriimonadaceae bacterium]|nr:family 20 glycosylhydrolase [Fimbriimonadaceae bacterium]
MQLRMWMYDLAREQAPTLDHLRTFCDMTREAGYNAIGLYLEHRFAYASAPWAVGTGAVSAEMVQKLVSEYPEIQIVPFVNLLGHFEGMLYTEEGKRFREERFQGMQACPSKPEFKEFALSLVDDVMKAFSSEIVHIGGDETWQLGKCEVCSGKVKEWDDQGLDGKAQLYSEHFAPVAQHVLAQGRRPAIWGDMLIDHPTAAEGLPKETLIFDWQYLKGTADTSRKFAEAGFEVVGCPALHTYNATWLHIPQSEKNVRDVTSDVRSLNGYGVCVTTWENGLFGSYDTLLPALRASGEILKGGKGDFLEHYLKASETYEEWARLMGVELQEAGGTFAFGGIRSSLKVRLLLNGNPFLAWLYHAEEFSGQVGERALGIAQRALDVAPNEACKGISLFARSAIEFVQLAEAARQRYAAGKPEEAIAKLAITRRIFEDLERVAKRTHERIGGSLADIERCKVGREHVERVIKRLREHGDGSLGYLPAFEHITHHKFVAHDQAAWWLINRWANE